VAFAVASVERLFKVLGDGSRLRILQALEPGELSVSEILQRTGLAQTLASFHLRILREAGVVATERRGPFIFYKLADVSLPNLLEACTKYSETLADTQPSEFAWPPWGSLRQLARTRRK